MTSFDLCGLLLRRWRRRYGVSRVPRVQSGGSIRAASKKNDWIVEGELTLNGRTRPLIIEFEFNGIQEFPGRNVHHAGFSATGSIKRSEYGIEFGLLPLGVDLLALGDEVKFEFDLEFIEPTDATL